MRLIIEAHLEGRRTRQSRVLRTSCAGWERMCAAPLGAATLAPAPQYERKIGTDIGAIDGFPPGFSSPALVPIFSA